MKILLTLVFALQPYFAVAEICGPQDYDSEYEPDFDCPSPNEAELVGSFGTPSSVPVNQGDQVVAPWEGALVHRDRMLQLGIQIKALRRLRWVDRLQLLGRYEIVLEAESQIAEARLEYANRQIESYRENVAQAINREAKAKSWWRSPVLWFTIGVLTAGACVALVAYGLGAVGG